MRKTIAFAVMALAGSACASMSPAAKDVKVYQATVATEDTSAPPLPSGCKMLGASGPIEQQQEDREISDPYRAERIQTANLGGNVLYLRSYLFKRLMKIDCPVGDTSPGCMNRSQNWYRVDFKSYACDTAALDTLANAPPPPSPAVFRFELVKTKPASTSPAAASTSAAAAPPAAAPAPVPTAAPAPAKTAAAAAETAALKAQVLELMKEGVGTDVIRLYVRAHPPAVPLTAEEIIDWKKSGIPDAVIEATFSK